MESKQRPTRRLGLLQRHLCAGVEEHEPGLSQTKVEEIRKRYDEERDKRLRFRPEGNAQYRRIMDLAKSDARFAKMLEDPWISQTEAQIRSEPFQDTVLVCIIGAGYGGLCAGARLREAGIAAKDIRIIEQASDVGGTWYYNRYPGAACDVEAYTYMPLCEELGYIPSERYAHQPELLSHSRMIAKEYGLYENACFGRKVTGLEWSEDQGLWIISTNHPGDRIRSQFVIMNFGTFTQPKLPGIPGLDEFRGHMFHTSRWDYEYTGGDSSGGLHKLHDKKVAIIGTGATAIQAIPHLGRDAKELYVFQRTPSSVAVRNNRKTTREFAEEALSKPGWQKERVDNFTIMTQTPSFGVKDLIQDEWTDIMRNLQQKFLNQRNQFLKAGRKEAATKINQLMEIADHEHMEKIRARVDEVVQDKDTAERLKPYYRQFCKRPCFHDKYLTTFNRSSVQLVDTAGKGVERLTANGVVANGIEYEVDCIVFATGFEVGYQAAGPWAENIGFDPKGINEISLHEKWSDGPRTFMSFITNGFPNMFMQNGPQGMVTTNFVQQLDETAKHAAYIISECVKRGIQSIEPKKEVEDEYSELVYNKSGRGQKFLRTCTPGYYNNEGQIVVSKTLASVAPYQPLYFFNLLEEMREGENPFQDYNLKYMEKGTNSH